MKMIQDIIIKPIITEASMDGMADRKYAFKVLKSATKPEIANAVETMFKGVKVADVNTINMKSKRRVGTGSRRTDFGGALRGRVRSVQQLRADFLRPDAANGSLSNGGG